MINVIIPTVSKVLIALHMPVPLGEVPRLTATRVLLDGNGVMVRSETSHTGILMNRTIGLTETQEKTALKFGLNVACLHGTIFSVTGLPLVVVLVYGQGFSVRWRLDAMQDSSRQMVQIASDVPKEHTKIPLTAILV
jgi:hypothetical protein